jgi:glycolate oxidase iron-sulfur subunit
VTPEQILAEADRCVKCGYCLPHCPTYALKADEGESPRGRIALIQALISGAIDSARLHAHLDACLACRACEAACPSGVNYGQIITSIREIQRKNSTPGAIIRAILHTLSHAPYANSTSGLANLYQRSGLGAITGKLGGKSIERLNNLLPDNIKTGHWQEIYPATGETIGRVGLFTGCISRITDRAALDAGIHILNRLGYEVVVPPNQGCCGAMHMHSGDRETADHMAQRNRDAFSGLELDTVVGVASGCTSHLKEHAHAEDMSELVTDISTFICSIPGRNDLRLEPLDRRVAIHTPCSMKNILRQASAPFQLLGLIPEIELVELPDDGLCCGAAGLYLVAHPQEADALRDFKIEALSYSRADILVTSNTGCALHLAAGVRAANMDAAVLHPVELLAWQMLD